MITRTDLLTSRADVIIVGGGLAGLSAAALVARSGRSVVVLEQSSQLGGRAATHTREGVQFNVGAHALYVAGEAFRLLRELKVPFAGRLPRHGRPLLLDRNKEYTLPQGLASLLLSGLLTAREKWRMFRLLRGLGQIDARAFDRIPLREWVTRTVGAGSLASLLAALFRVSTYAADHDAVSAGAAIDQLRTALAAGVWYLDGGWQTLIDGLRARAAACGADVRTESRVRSIEAGDEVTARLTDGGELRAGAVILTVAPSAARDLLDLPPEAPLSRWVAGHSPIKAATLDVALSRLPRPERRFALGLDQAHYYSVHSATARLAPDGVAVLHAMRYLVGGEAPKATEADLEALLDRMQPGWRGHVLTQRFLPGLVVTHALPRATDGGLSSRPGAAVEGRPGVFLAGDWVGDHGMLADASAASARRAAGLALARRRPTYAGR
jgi:phytoene dehydrogenase-like protein